MKIQISPTWHNPLTWSYWKTKDYEDFAGFGYCYSNFAEIGPFQFHWYSDK